MSYKTPANGVVCITRPVCSLIIYIYLDNVLARRTSGMFAFLVPSAVLPEASLCPSFSPSGRARLGHDNPSPRAPTFFLRQMPPPLCMALQSVLLLLQKSERMSTLTNYTVALSKHDIWKIKAQRIPDNLWEDEGKQGVTVIQYF